MTNTTELEKINYHVLFLESRFAVLKYKIEINTKL